MSFKGTKGVIASTTKETSENVGFRIDSTWYTCTKAVWGFAKKLKGQEIEITGVETGSNGKEVVNRIQGQQQAPQQGQGQGGNSYQGKGGGNKGGYDNVGQQIGNALTNATAVVVARDGAKASIEAVGVEARNIIVLSEQLRKELTEGKIKPKAPAPAPAFEEEEESSSSNDSGFSSEDDGGFDDDIPF